MTATPPPPEAPAYIEVRWVQPPGSTRQVRRWVLLRGGAVMGTYAREHVAMAERDRLNRRPGVTDADQEVTR